MCSMSVKSVITQMRFCKTGVRSRCRILDRRLWPLCAGEQQQGNSWTAAAEVRGAATAFLSSLARARPEAAVVQFPFRERNKMRPGGGDVNRLHLSTRHKATGHGSVIAQGTAWMKGTSLAASEALGTAWTRANLSP